MPDDTSPIESRCPVCRGEGRYAFTGTDRLHDLPGEFRYAECRECGAVYQTPTPGPEQIASFYPEEYAPYRPGKAKRRNPIERAVLRSVYGYSHLDSGLPGWFARALGSVAYRDAVPYVRDGQLLDIGCGGCKYLLAMQQLGWQPRGVEFNAFAVQTCHEAGLDVFQVELRDAAFADASFDLVTARHVIEHIPDPVAFVGEIYRIVKPGGMMVLKTPNSAALGRDWFGTDWYANDVPRHLLLFAPDNLTLLAERAGFETAVVRTFSTPKIVLNSWDYRQHNPGESSKKNKLRRAVARLYVMAAAVSGRGDEVFAIFRKPAHVG